MLGLHVEVVVSKLYPPRQLVHWVGSELLHDAHGISQFLAHPKEFVSVYPARQAVQDDPETHVWQNSEQTSHSLSVFKKNPVPQLTQTACWEPEHCLQLARQGRHLPPELMEYPSEQV